jgi:hypothetical protein
MGSGKFPEAGLLNTAYVRNPKYHDVSLFGVEPPDDFHMVPYVPLCYGRAPMWNHKVILGGPGGFNSGCIWP